MELINFSYYSFIFLYWNSTPKSMFISDWFHFFFFFVIPLMSLLFINRVGLVAELAVCLCRRESIAFVKALELLTQSRRYLNRHILLVKKKIKKIKNKNFSVTSIFFFKLFCLWIDLFRGSNSGDSFWAKNVGFEHLCCKQNYQSISLNITPAGQLGGDLYACTLPTS